MSCWAVRSHGLQCCSTLSPFWCPSVPGRVCILTLPATPVRDAFTVWLPDNFPLSCASELRQRAAHCIASRTCTSGWQHVTCRAMVSPTDAGLVPCVPLQNESDAYRKMRLRVENVQGRNCLTNFWVSAGVKAGTAVAWHSIAVPGNTIRLLQLLLPGELPLSLWTAGRELLVSAPSRQQYCMDTCRGQLVCPCIEPGVLALQCVQQRPSTVPLVCSTAPDAVSDK